MKFNFAVKHNGVLYPAGKEVPIGKEAKKENEIADKSATEIKKELKEVYGVKKFNGTSKVDLMKQLAEEEAKAKAVAEEEAKETETSEDEEKEVEETNETESNDETSLLDKIVNE